MREHNNSSAGAHHHCVALAYSLKSIGFQNYPGWAERRITLQGVSLDPPQESIPDGDRAAKAPDPSLSPWSGWGGGKFENFSFFGVERDIFLFKK